MIMMNDDVDNDSCGDNDCDYREMCALSCGARVFERAVFMMMLIKFRWYS